MSRVYTRPTALLDGAPEAARIVEPGSDAESYVSEGRVYEKIPSFLGYLSLLAHPEMPRMGGYVRRLNANSHTAVVVRGEDTQPGEEVPVYGFGLSPDGVEEFVEVARYTGEYGENIQLLSWVDIKDPNNPVFRTPDLIGVIDNPAKIEELTQLLAIGQDAAEWALD
ncbi:MAG: hypothetical protein ACXWLH_01395 [Candidatus Saccharimonadales bacterium]